ncbi:hypothetical protein [uncultured Clostridium sp.]|uniref:hypothetical protein n=1 Tax=uncultured Clostridium sp. TaxID=59620 RepID=UPI00262FE594|nr:hypothetical protein [uncultured Clostridium sp.]
MGRKCEYTVTLILPNDMEALEEKFAEVMADIVAEKLTHEELGYYIKRLEEIDKICL